MDLTVAAPFKSGSCQCGGTEDEASLELKFIALACPWQGQRRHPLRASEGVEAREVSETQAARMAA